MIDIVVKDDRRYKEYTEKNGYIRIRKLCLLEKCNSIASPDYCKRHTITGDFIICETCSTPTKKIHLRTYVISAV